MDTIDVRFLSSAVLARPGRHVKDKRPEEKVLIGDSDRTPSRRKKIPPSQPSPEQKAQEMLQEGLERLEAHFGHKKALEMVADEVDMTPKQIESYLQNGIPKEHMGEILSIGLGNLTPQMIFGDSHRQKGKDNDNTEG